MAALLDGHYLNGLLALKKSKFNSYFADFRQLKNLVPLVFTKLS